MAERLAMTQSGKKATMVGERLSGELPVPQSVSLRDINVMLGFQPRITPQILFF